MFITLPPFEILNSIFIKTDMTDRNHGAISDIHPFHIPPYPPFRLIASDGAADRRYFDYIHNNSAGAARYYSDGWFDWINAKNNSS